MIDTFFCCATFPTSTVAASAQLVVVGRGENSTFDT